MRPPWLGDRTCLVEGCEHRAPGTHPFCRQHAAQLARDEYRQLRFQGDSKQLADLLKTLKAS